jgi:hypothetical protein
MCRTTPWIDKWDPCLEKVIIPQPSSFSRMRHPSRDGPSEAWPVGVRRHPPPLPLPRSARVWELVLLSHRCHQLFQVLRHELLRLDLGLRRGSVHGRWQAEGSGDTGCTGSSATDCAGSSRFLRWRPEAEGVGVPVNGGSANSRREKSSRRQSAIFPFKPGSIGRSGVSIESSSQCIGVGSILAFIV